jgi:hypothetical protein
VIGDESLRGKVSSRRHGRNVYVEEGFVTQRTVNNRSMATHGEPMMLQMTTGRKESGVERGLWVVGF